jgi:beta-phosphoglucomutase
MFTAVLFDMNGVIIDDEHVHELAFKEALKPHGIELDHQGYLDYFAGRTDRAGFEAVAKELSKVLPIDELLDQKMQEYLRLFPAQKRSFPGVIELIHELAGKCKLAVVTNSTRMEAELITREFEIVDFFELITTAEDITRAKPDPEPYLKTAELLGVEPSHCMVIEDSGTGVTAAKAAGCTCIGITTTHSPEDLAQADHIFANFDEVTQFLLSEGQRFGDAF